MSKLTRLFAAAALLVFPLAACDEGSDDPIEPEPAVGTVSGTVSVEGDGLAGVTVSLAGASPQSTTTGADGSYSFTNVVEGTYSVTLSAVPADVVFSQTSQSVAITSDGQVASADFNGQYIRTASILVTVAQGGEGVATNVNVTGPDGYDTTLGTNANGQVQFTGLRAGSYTVSLPNPPEAFADAEDQTVNLNTGQTAQVNFTTSAELEEANISIQSITVGGVPVTLANVAGQIEVTVNIDRADETPTRIDVLIGGEVVASQSFALPAIDEPARQSNESITLNVPTTQLVMTEGGAWIPVIENGGKTVSANLFVAERSAPTPSNEVPVVMQNLDRVIPPLDGVLTFEMEDGAKTATGSDGKMWAAGAAQFSGAMYISFSTKTPTSVVWPTTAGAGLACSTGDATGSVSGDADTGFQLTVDYGCAGASGTSITPNTGAAPTVTLTPAGPGPDGTAVVTPTGFSALGATFTLDGETRRFLLPSAPAGTLSISSVQNIDNVAPSVFVACEYDVDGDGEPTTECDATKPLDTEQVAFNDLFDERWINADYTFEDDVLPNDSAGGAVGVGLMEWGASLFDEGSLTCGTVLLANGDDLDVTDASDGTPDGHRVCGLATDLLMNSATSEAPSNFFGVDKLDPVVRIGGEGPDPLTGTSPLDGGTGQPVADTTGANISTIYNLTDSLDASMVWALEALDDRAGFNENAVDSFPVRQSITRQTATVDSTWLSPNYAFQMAPLSDTYRRTVEEDFLGPWIEGPDADEGYYYWSGEIFDRAGNQVSISYNWMVDQADSAVVSGVSFGQTFYTPGADAAFNLFGSDDLEVIESEMGFGHRTALDTMNLIVGQFNLDSYMRFDGVMPNPYDASLITQNVIGDAVTIPGAWVYGRIDFTCSAAATPYASCGAADEVPATMSDFNTVVGGTAGDATDLLPINVQAELIDAGMNESGATATSNFLAGQWTDSTAIPWAGAEITSWAVTLNGSTYEAVHETNTSVTAPFFDAVVLVANDGAGNLYICDGTFSYDGSTDNGLMRFYNYSIAAPAAGTTCGDVIGGGGSAHAVGVSGSALLATQGIT